MALTKNKQLSKAEQMLDSIERILQQPKEVALVKMADRVANLSNPQLCWSLEKMRYYLHEASLILDKIAFADKKMARQLEKSIEKYENKVCYLIYKLENMVEAFKKISC